ncbi:MAG: nucleotide exchange factor GrpE [Bacilli bacterium]|nr:nucleotide exchange factor GrpE [Bacilli bacterium]
MDKLKEETLVKEDTSEERSKKANRKEKKFQEEIERLTAEVNHWKNEYYRAYADTKNLRTSLERDHSKAMKYRAEGFIDGLLPVLDSFHMALQNEPTDPALKNYLTGFQYIYRNLVAALESEGVSEIAPAIDQKFDADTMNAVDTVESEGEEKLIKKVYANGYKLHDRIVRPAMVSVSAKPQPKEEEKLEETKEEKLDA